MTPIQRWAQRSTEKLPPPSRSPICLFIHSTMTQKHSLCLPRAECWRPRDSANIEHLLCAGYTSSTEAHLGPIAVGSYSCGSHHPIKQPLKLGSEEVAHLECEPRCSVSASPEHSTLTLKFMAVQTKAPRGVHWRGQALGPVCTVHLRGEH